MSLPSALGAYKDVEKIWNEFLPKGGGSVRFSERRHAIRFRQRAYMWRTLNRRRLKEGMPPEYEPVTPYDDWSIILDRQDSCVLHFISYNSATPISEATPIEVIPFPGDLDLE